MSPATMGRSLGPMLETGVGTIDNEPRRLDPDHSVRRSLTAPIVCREGYRGLVQLADAPVDYDADDLELLQRISDMVAPAIHARINRDKLTPREAEVMDLIVSGRTQKQIAAELDISVQTAAKHRTRVLDKLSVNNDVELVHLALQIRNPIAMSVR